MTTRYWSFGVSLFYLNWGCDFFTLEIVTIGSVDKRRSLLSVCQFQGDWEIDVAFVRVVDTL